MTLHIFGNQSPKFYIKWLTLYTKAHAVKKKHSSDKKKATYIWLFLFYFKKYPGCSNHCDVEEGGEK